MRGKIITYSATALAIAAVTVVSYQAIGGNSATMKGSLWWPFGSSSSSVMTSASSSTTSASSSSGCGLRDGQCGGTCGTNGDMCMWLAQSNSCVCQPSSSACGGSNGQCGGSCPYPDDACVWLDRGAGSYCACRTSSSSSSTPCSGPNVYGQCGGSCPGYGESCVIQNGSCSCINTSSSSVCSSNPGAVTGNCPSSGEVPGTCNPSTCQSEHYNGMCLYGGLCATVSGSCSNSDDCDEQFRPCGDTTCGGYCGTYGETCQNLGTNSAGDPICGCRGSGFSSSF